MTVAACPDQIHYWLRPTRHCFPSVIALALAAIFVFSAPAASAPAFSALVVDAHDGKVLFSQNPDAQRYPASLTKVMTLYILFEELKAQRLKLNSKLQCSAHSAGRPPSRLGLRPSDRVSVEDAIKALVTRSANDVAATIAENISGSESAFAIRMTNTAKALGMTKTTFRNASGLPDPRQVTTARDMATLSLRIQRDFPEYYPYFRIASFSYKGKVIRTHNRLLGNFAGTDGIKTGYIRASGYNLASSVARKGKRLVGVVMGGKTGGARNAYMMSMLDKHFPKASSSNTNQIAALAGDPPGLNSKDAVALASATNTPGTAAGVPRPKFKPDAGGGAAEGSATPAPNLAIAANEQPSSSKQEETLPVQGGELATLLPENGEPAANGAAGTDDGEGEAGSQGDLGWPVPSSVSKGHMSTPKDKLASDSLFKIAAAAAAEDPGMTRDATPKPRPSWQIQIGAYPTKDGAMRIIEKALSLDLDPLTGKTAFALPITRGASTLYRARFSGFNQDTAKAACKELVRKGVSCLPLAPQG